MILLLVQRYDFFIIYEVKNSAFYEDKTDLIARMWCL